MAGKKKIVVVGGGFAGIQLIRQLDEELFDILLIDKINHHQFQPLFYQVATSQIEPSSISFPFRNVFNNKKNLQIRLAEVLGVDAANNKVNTTLGDFDYDYLVISIGCKTNFFGNDNISSHSYSLKTTYDGITIRNHILQTFENIISANDEVKESLLNLVIVGAGATGVELAGAFAEIKNNVLSKDYPGIDFSKFKIILVGRSKETLANMSASSQIASWKYLDKMGVTVLTETSVKDYDGTIITLNNGNTIKSKTLIWTAGVIGNTIQGLPANSIVGGNRIKVNRINKVAGSENIFALGDIAYMETPKYPKGHPQVANVAINQARNLGRNFKKIIQGKPTTDYEYTDLGTMATIGRNKAVVDFSFIKFKGYFAWFVWMLLHLYLIVSVRNKVIIFINWSWAYITKDTSLRLIMTQEKEKP